MSSVSRGKDKDGDQHPSNKAGGWGSGIAVEGKNTIKKHENTDGGGSAALQVEGKGWGTACVWRDC